MKERTKEQAFQEMMMSPGSARNDNPTFLLKDKDKKDQPDKDEPIFNGNIKNEKIADKYKVEILKEAEKNPNGVMIDTPDGRMSIKQAIEKGYDPKSGKFTRKKLERPSLDKHMEGKGFSPQQKGKMKQFTDPRSFSMKPDEQKRMGYKEKFKGSNKYDEKTEAPERPAQPSKLEALLGGAQGGGFNAN